MKNRKDYNRYYKKRNVLLAGIMSALLLVGCGAVKNETDNSTSEGVQKLTAQQAYEKIESGDPVVIVDVRTKEEYNAGHIKDAILIPNEEIKDEKPELLPVEDAEILVYCRSGNRSAQAAEKLKKMGYSKVYDFGGINDWTYGTVDTPWEEK
ncbi:MAG: rhodanese-like domain-containing protein [Lachnospiraceae bacterium]|nr:rhodanese-like domain-containing protein [Lachnospiraceae bacterium]